MGKVNLFPSLIFLTLWNKQRLHGCRPQLLTGSTGERRTASFFVIDAELDSDLSIDDVTSLCLTLEICNKD